MAANSAIEWTEATWNPVTGCTKISLGCQNCYAERMAHRPKARPMSPLWAKGVRDQCLTAGVPFFFKQWEGSNNKKAGRVLDGRTWDEMPVLAETG
ncbi:MAG: DUF5131 family protein [Deltaproteobacteria bacterium]|nr:DUF5131 family protein [Deltaproteobacteria bacterium]MBW1793080.1 DUF5131 family protein [Deltaproteobacteria bacterium]MBW2330235.1 DUF5131 family protein [Deltaproteobacteria bacterium]